MQRPEDSLGFFLGLSHFFFKSLADLELNKWASLGASEPHDPLVSASPARGLQVHPTTPGFFF